MRITKKSVEALPLPEKGQSLFWDDELRGFGVRVTPGGVKAYIVQGRVNGNTRRKKLGVHGKITADEARTMAKKELVKLLEGVDPSAQKVRDKALSVTLRQAMKSYISDRSLKKSSISCIVKHIEGNSFGAWADRPLASISRDHVMKRFRELSASGPVQANQAFRILRAILNYAREQYRDDHDNPVLPENPVNILSGAKVWNPVKARSAKVPDNRIGAVWNRITELRTQPALRSSVNTGADLAAFLMVTGARLMEAASLRWENVNLTEGWWKIVDPKNHNPLTLPLSSLALGILKARPKGGNYVFAAKTKHGHVYDIRHTMEKISETAGVDLSAHDLRRTYRAVAGEAGLELWKTKLLLNHKPGTDVTLQSYTETSDLRYLEADAEAIAKLVEVKAIRAAAGNVIDFPQQQAVVA